jgi:type II secretory pathway pseudopilin PulG
MYLEGQARRASTAFGERGFALAGMLVAIAVMSVMLMVALPTWRHQVQREKEAELVFRGEQYARAIGLYQRKLAGAFPPSLDILVEQKFLRKKYKDPITGEDFVPVFANSAEAMGLTPPTTAATATSTGARSNDARARAEAARRGNEERIRRSASPTRLAGAAGGIIGVRSKSSDRSIRIYKGREQYDQWLFTYTAPPEQAVPAANPGPVRQATPGGRGTASPVFPPQRTPGFPQRGRGGF